VTPPHEPLERKDQASDTVASDSIVRNAAFAAASTAIGAAFSVALTLYLVRALDPHGYGTFTLAIAIGALFAVPMDLGVSSSAARFVAEHRGERTAIAAIVASALRLKLAVSCSLGLALALAAGPIADLYNKPGLVWPLRGIAVGLVANSITTLFSQSWVAQGRIRAGFNMAFAQSAGSLLGSVVLVSLGAGATGAAFGRSIGYVAGLFAGVFLITRLFGRQALDFVRTKGRVREVARYAGFLAVVEGAYLFFDQMDALLIGAFLSSASVGLFQAAFGLTVFMHYPAGVVATGVAPRVTGSRGKPPNIDAFRAAIRFLIVGYGALLAPIVVWATPIVHLLLGANYDHSASVLRAFAPYVLLAGVGALLSPAANYLGQARKRLPVAISAVAINLVFDLIFIQRIGIVAGAIGTDIALAVYVPAHLWICARAVRIPLAPLGLALLRALAAAGAMAGVLYAFGTSDLTVLDWFAGAILGTAAYLAVLFVTRELSVNEARAAKSWLATRFG